MVAYRFLKKIFSIFLVHSLPGFLKDLFSNILIYCMVVEFVKVLFNFLVHGFLGFHKEDILNIFNIHPQYINDFRIYSQHLGLWLVKKFSKKIFSKFIRSSSLKGFIRGIFSISWFILT